MEPDLNMHQYNPFTNAGSGWMGLSQNTGTIKMDGFPLKVATKQTCPTPKKESISVRPFGRVFFGKSPFWLVVKRSQWETAPILRVCILVSRIACYFKSRMGLLFEGLRILRFTERTMRFVDCQHKVLNHTLQRGLRTKKISDQNKDEADYGL